MSSTNEEMPKPRVSPLEYRNTDLVSRLLAATPSYLYNMPLVPHSYFFSEMLRSFVQAKSQNHPGGTTPPGGAPPHRRSRKRVWSQLKPDVWPNSKDHGPYKGAEHKDDASPWPAKLSPSVLDSKCEKPLELTTTNKLDAAKISHKSVDLEKGCDPGKSETQMTPEVQQVVGPNQLSYASMMSETGNQQQDLILPPPPPIWYPPLYPPPYGIDPLHFFIDLRVSGHIYDRKKDSPNVPPPPSFMLSAGTTSATGGTTSSEPPPPPPPPDHLQLSRESLFKQTRHTSAFSVPNRNGGPINLSHAKDETKAALGFGEYCRPEDDKTKYGGFKRENKVSTNYVMQNLQHIYNVVLKQNRDEADGSCDIKKDGLADGDENGEEKPKACKDLSALIGLELVVDYVKHEKPTNKKDTGEVQIFRPETPDLEIVESPGTF